MLYSFCAMRKTLLGRTLPWQLLAAQDPGPLYLRASSGCGARVCVFVCSGGFFLGCTLTCATANGANAHIQTNNERRREVVARIAMIPPRLISRSPRIVENPN